MGYKSKQMFKAAYGKFGIGAFNVFSAEQVQAVFSGAGRSQAPILVAVTPAARGYLRPEIIAGMISGAEQAFPDVVFSRAARQVRLDCPWEDTHGSPCSLCLGEVQSSGRTRDGSNGI